MTMVKMLEQHALWVSGMGGLRLEYHANLQNANLQDANLRDANLRDANLCGADLGGADLWGAIGVLHPPINDPRGYRCVAVLWADGWRVGAGCRWYTLGEAREHWGPAYLGNRTIGDMYLAGVEWLVGRERG